jgi:hypothetical protein
VAGIGVTATGALVHALVYERVMSSIITFVNGVAINEAQIYTPDGRDRRLEGVPAGRVGRQHRRDPTGGGRAVVAVEHRHAAGGLGVQATF